LRTATFKIRLFGDGGVGKTTLTQRYVSDHFNKSTKMTIGVDIVTKIMEIRDWSVTLQIWDFGGEERFRFFLPAYARGSFGAIFMYDITRYSTLMDFDTWMDVFQKGIDFKSNPIPFIMVGGKIDLDHKRGVFYDEAFNFALSRDVFTVIECSSKTGENVELIFKLITHKIMKDIGYI